MPTCKGIPTYTLDSVAFPHIPKTDRTVDGLTVSFDAKGGGTNAEFRFEWINLGDRFPIGGLQILCFSDGLPALRDDRIAAVLARLARVPTQKRDVPPARLVELLEQEGIVPSLYQLRALLEAYPRQKERDEINQQMARLRRHEGAA